MDKKIWNKMLIALLLTFAVLALVVFRFANPAAILAEIRELSDLLLGLAFASMALSWIVDALRLRTLTLAVRARPPIFDQRPIQPVLQFSAMQSGEYK